MFLAKSRNLLFTASNQLLAILSFKIATAHFIFQVYNFISCSESVHVLHFLVLNLFQLIFVFVSFVIFFHFFRYCISSLHACIFNLFMFSSTWSFHLLFGLPSPMLTSGLHILPLFFTALLSSIILIWRYQRISITFMIFTKCLPFRMSSI